ncbi:7-carboxy-7-deazaguanine synthase QueE [Salinisphaera orenii]|uniref:7-carboxy-7-deazaguanine synthase QueE n=1 Tax=Salinisphaera orenii TaxID=856731 RepID=UPI003A4C67B7
MRITEIFCSLQGEGRDAGALSTFVRLTGCPLRCSYCDTTYAFHGGGWQSLDDILASCDDNRAPYVCVTGGEPLAQPNTARLVERLCDNGYQVSVETAGALDIRPIDTRASRVVDIKTPDSGEASRNLSSNIAALTDNDQLKFVLCSRTDYEWARDMVVGLELPPGCPVWFSPAAGCLDPGQLGDWMVADRVPARLQLQLHKQLWGDKPGR